MFGGHSDFTDFHERNRNFFTVEVTLLFISQLSFPSQHTSFLWIVHFIFPEVCFLNCWLKFIPYLCVILQPEFVAS